MNSLVRQTAGIGFTGARYEKSFVLADVEMTWAHGRDEVMLFFSPAGLVVVAPLPSGAFRIVVTLDNAPEHPEIADVQALLNTRGPTQGVGAVSHVHRSSRFRLHHRVADQYRRGRFLLVGDAAHVHSPAGGQETNTGLVDACVLGRLLANVTPGRRDESHLDTYEALRRPTARRSGRPRVPRGRASPGGVTSTRSLCSPRAECSRAAARPTRRRTAPGSSRCGGR